jgi:hypothetical protein
MYDIKIPPCHVLLSGVPFFFRLYQKTAEPATGTAAVPKTGNAVLPPTSTSVS